METLEKVEAMVTVESDPAVWYSAEFTNTEQWIFKFQDSHIGELEKAVAASLDVPIADLEKTDFSLPQLGSELRRIRETLIKGRGFHVLRGLPVDAWSREVSARAYYGIGCHLGVPVSQNASGHLLGHVKDLGVDPLDPVNRIYQTRHRQPYHTDSTDIVGLMCLQKAKSGGRSTICSSTTVYHEIARRRPDLVKVLLEPFTVDRKSEIPQGKAETYQLAVFHRYAGKITCIYSRDFIDAAQRHDHVARLRPEQVEALDLLDELACSDPIRLDLEFEPGDIQLLHNHQILHARTPYEDWPETERKRHLLRLWLSTADGRPLPPAFEERYGPIVEGRPRGGIRVPGAEPNVVLHS